MAAAPYKSPESVDINQCRWLDCTIVFNTAEELYEHITSSHIGRKSAGTLSLECHWAGCTSKASKRDHLTSHARVHINLKPHTCEICSKSFKRPQDLKKHEKIHTEEHHQHHKHSKAVTVPGTGAGSTPSTNAAAGAFNGAHFMGDKNAQMHPAFAQFPGYGYGYPFGPHPFMNNPMGTNPMDIAQVLEHQRQLNAAVSAGGFAGGAAAYGMPYGAGFPNMPQMYGMPGPNGIPFQFGYPYPMPMPMPPSQTQLATPPHQTTSPQLQPVIKSEDQSPNNSLYPTLPQPMGLYPTVSSPAEDLPSPANSHHSHHSHHTHRSNHSVASASVSPKVPSLSPASITNSPYSPSPEHEVDASFRRVYSGNAVAGTKRGFEEAAGEFFQDVKSKRYNADDDSLFRQIEKIDELGLLLSSDSHHSLTPARSHDDSSSSSVHSDYNRPDVENLNDFLLQLGQNLDSLPVPAPNSFNLHDTANQQQQQNSYSPLYPSLPNSNYDRPTAGMPARGSPYADHGLASIRLSKAPTAPTMGANDFKTPSYRLMERLQRAPPSSWREARTISMDIDDEESGSSKYSSSIRSTSMDVPVEDEKPIRLAPIITVGSSEGRGPQLSPIVSPVDTPTSKTTLPSIRSLISYPDVSAASSPMSESGSNSSSVRPSLSPSNSESPRPSTSGGVDRLVHRVTKLGVTCFEENESENEEMKEDDHRQKKTRVASPEPMEDEEEKAAVVMRRRATITALIVMINARYRQALAAKNVPVKEERQPLIEVAA